MRYSHRKQQGRARTTQRRFPKLNVFEQMHQEMVSTLKGELQNLIENNGSQNEIAFLQQRLINLAA